MDPRLYMLAGTFALLVIALIATIVTAVRAARQRRSWMHQPPLQEIERIEYPAAHVDAIDTNLDGLDVRRPMEGATAELLAPLRIGDWQPPEGDVSIDHLSELSLTARIQAISASPEVLPAERASVPTDVLETEPEDAPVPNVAIAETVVVPTTVQPPMPAPTMQPPVPVTLSESDALRIPEVIRGEAAAYDQPIIPSITVAEQTPAVTAAPAEQIPSWADLLPEVALEPVVPVPAPEPTPEPAPAAQPVREPGPAPEPEPTPAPEPAPEPAHELEPVPEPVPVSVATLAPESASYLATEFAMSEVFETPSSVETAPTVPVMWDLMDVAPEASEIDDSDSLPADAFWAAMFSEPVDSAAVLGAATPFEVPAASIEPVAPAPVAPEPIAPAQVAPAPVAPAPVTSAPVPPVPVAPALVAPEPIATTSAVAAEVTPTPDHVPVAAPAPRPTAGPTVVRTAVVPSPARAESAASSVAAPIRERPPRPRTVVRSLFMDEGFDAAPSALEPLAPSVPAVRLNDANAQIEDIVMAAPVEMWFGESRVGVKAGTRTYDQFRKYADVLFADLGAAKASKR